MEKWKKVCIGLFVLSNIAVAVDKTQSVDIEINNDANPSKLERQALLGGSGDRLINDARIKVDGSDPDNNANLSGIRGQNAEIINNAGKTIEIDSIQGGAAINAGYSAEPTSATESNTGTVTNHGLISIIGKEATGILGHGGNTGAGVTITNEATGVITIDSSSQQSVGINLKGGTSENKGTINIAGHNSRSVGMEILHNENIDGVQRNSGTINLNGNALIAMNGPEELGMARTSNRTSSINTTTGRIIGTGNSLRGIISSKGGQVENHGTIILTGNLNYGISSENKVVVGTKIAGYMINSGSISIIGNLGSGIIGINVRGINNSGTVLIEGNSGIGIRYYNLDTGQLINTGEVILDGTDNWAFATDEEKSALVESVGKVTIRDGSRDSGAFKVTGVIARGINHGDVTAINGTGNKIIYVEDGTNSSGVTVPNRGIAENRGNIDIQGGTRNFGIHSKNGAQVINSGTIKNSDTGGVAIYNPNGQLITNTGTIELSGSNQIAIYYENQNIGVTNTGNIIIKGNGIIAFDTNAGDFTSGRTDLYVSSVGNTEVKVFGNVLIDTAATASMGAYARNTIKKAINQGTIRIKGSSSSGLVGLDGTTLENLGTIIVENADSYGIQAINDATVINDGSISNTATNGVAIYMGNGDSNLYMDEKATVVGRVVSAGGLGRFFGKDSYSSSLIHRINYSLERFSHMDIESGEFSIEKDTTLIAPDKSLPAGHEDTSTYTGNLRIAPDATLTMEVTVNKVDTTSGKEKAGDTYTSTIHANSLNIEGNLVYKPLDKVYVVGDDVTEIEIPNIYTNNEILGATADKIKVDNVVSGWQGSFRLSADKTNLSMILTRRLGEEYLPPSYRDGVWNYPASFLNKKYLSESAEIIDRFKVIDKVHNAEIPYYIDVAPILKGGNYQGGDKKGFFHYDSYGAKIDSYYKMRENLILGLGFTGLESDVRYTHKSQEKLNSYILNGNIVYKMEDFKIGAYVAGSINKHDLERGVTDKGYILDSNYESYGAKLGISGEYKYRVSRDNYLSAYFDIGYMFNYLEAYKEEGHADYRMNLPSLKENIGKVKIGGKWSHRAKNRFTELGVNLNYFYSEKVKDRIGYYIFNEKAKYKIRTTKLPEFIVSVDLKREYDINDRLSVYGLISAEMGEKFWQASGRVGVTYEF